MVFKSMLHMKSFAIKIFLFFGTLLLLWGVLEIGYRSYVFLKKPLYKPSSLPSVGWEFTPGANRILTNSMGKPIHYMINRDGFRDDSTDNFVNWDEDDFKLVIVGDSIIAGAEVMYESTIAAFVEEELEKQGISSRVVNMGVEATNTLQQGAMIKYKALPLHPDHVVLGFFLNDIEQRYIERMIWPLSWIIRKSHFAAFAVFRFGHWLRRIMSENEIRASVPRQTVQHRGCGQYESMLLDEFASSRLKDIQDQILKIVRMTKENQVGLSIVLFPFASQINGVCHRDPQDRLIDFFETHHIDYIDLLPLMKKHQGQPLYSPRDGIHPNEEGNRMIAQAITDNFLKNLLRNETL